MAPSDAGRLAARFQLLQRVLADRLQHPEARLAVRRPRLRRTRLLATSDSRPSSTSMPRSPSASQTASAASSVQPPDEDRQAAEQAPLVLVQQVVAPGDGVAQRLLAGREIARAAGQQRQPALQPAQHRLGRQQPDAGRRQLDRQRQAVQPGADLGHGRGVLVGQREVGPDRACSLRRRARRPAYCESGLRRRLARRASGSASGGTAYSCSPRSWSGSRLVTSTAEAGTGRQQVGDDGRGRQDLLEVVEHSRSDRPRR